MQHGCPCLLAKIEELGKALRLCGEAQQVQHLTLAGNGCTPASHEAWLSLPASREGYLSLSLSLSIYLYRIICIQPHQQRYRPRIKRVVSQSFRSRGLVSQLERLVLQCLKRCHRLLLTELISSVSSHLELDCYVLLGARMETPIYLSRGKNSRCHGPYLLMPQQSQTGTLPRQSSLHQASSGSES